MSAPFIMRAETVSECPFVAARCKAVFPSWSLNLCRVCPLGSSSSWRTRSVWPEAEASNKRLSSGSILYTCIRQMPSCWPEKHINTITWRNCTKFLTKLFVTIVFCYINLSNLVWTKGFDTIIFCFPGVLEFGKWESSDNFAPERKSHSGPNQGGKRT